MATPRRVRLTADDWIRAALAAWGEGGLAAVAVEPLAARLGATKGSFYWHFANRDALVVAVLERWEREHTQAIIEDVEDLPDARSRLRRLLGRVLASAGRDPVEAQMLAAADHPLVADVVRRVVGRRVDYLSGLFEEAGFDSAAARHRAVLMYTAYAGHDQLALRLPGMLVPDAAYRETVLAVALDGRREPAGQ